MKKGNIKLVTFDEETHKYNYCGKELKGVTSIIAKTLGKSFPKTTAVQLACSYGSQVHKESELWIKEGKIPETENGKWVVEQLKLCQKRIGEKNTKYDAEVRVSDFENTASNVDVVLHTLQGVFLFDIKTGKFDRTYCSMQLNSYRLMYENCYDEKVIGMFVLCTKSKRLFTIYQCYDNDILNLLEKNV